MKKLKIAKEVLALALAIVFFLACGVCAIVYFSPKGESEKVQKRVIELWHVESFEGGKGSRASYLKTVARRYEKAENSVFVLVRSFTQEGFVSAVKEGARPDLLSFGTGVGAPTAWCHALSYDFSPAEENGKTLAYPWCSGKYFLFSISGDFSDVSDKNTILSRGGGVVEFAAALHGLFGEFSLEESTTAYVRFLGGGYKYMLGTGRDVCRFQARGVAVKSLPVSAYNDLYQYIAVTTAEKESLPFCYGFVEELLGKESQEGLSSIGTYPVSSAKGEFSISAFLTQGEAELAREEGVKSLRLGQTKISKKYLKALK